MAMATAEADKLRPRIVMLSFAQQGHINPLMQLAKALANRGAEVTFVVSENTVPKAGAATATPNLSFVGLADNLPPERSRGSNFRDSVDSMVNMEPGFAQFLAQVRHQVSAVIYDAFMTWVPPISSSLSIPCFCFFTSNAISGALFYYVPSLVQRGVLPFRPDGVEDIPLSKDKVKGMEGLPELLPEEFPLCLTFDSTHFRYRFVKKIGEMLHEASAIILNTMDELEPEPIAALKGQKPVFSVGPLLLLSGRPSRLDVNYWPEEDHCLAWLDTQERSSVLFVSFGSVASLSLAHFQELAQGLEASGQPFLWVVRADAIDVPLEEALPDGFRDRTKERGLIISWGPQLLILSHPAVGGFFTHGGWNSIIENISTGSVPMICWPHVAEQRLNRRLMAEFWKIGVGLQHRADGSVAKEEIARVVRELFHGGEQGKELRQAAKQVGEMAKKAVAEEGSSRNNFESLYTLLSSNVGLRVASLLTSILLGYSA